MFRRFVIGLAGLILVTLWHQPAKAAIIYSLVNQVLPSGFDLSVTGTIETDGTIGALALANITGINITVDDGMGNSFNFNNVSNISFFVAVTATAIDLSIPVAAMGVPLFGVDENGMLGLGTGNSWQIGNTFLGIAVDGFDDFGGAWTGFPVFAQVTTAVPEPGTLALLGIGLAGLGVVTRRRRKAMTG